jgi:antitoxin component YwqK of YwqJK toxin-antitoxin module
VASSVEAELAPDCAISAADPGLRNINGVLLLNGVPWSGQVLDKAGTRLLARTHYLAGRRHGRALAWFDDGKLAQNRYFRLGKREGTHLGWWPNGRVQFVRQYRNDLFEGEQQAYYESGERFETRRYLEGREEGRQTEWARDGRVLANYVFKGGKRYGIVGRFDCVTIHTP